MKLKPCIGCHISIPLFLVLILHAPIQAQIDRANFITHGPTLGRLSQNSIGIWARTAYPGDFAVRYGTGPEELTQTSPPCLTQLKHDNTGWIQLKDLLPDTLYHYELILPKVDLNTGRKGTFRTLPDENSYRHPQLNPRGLFNFSFEFACGNNQTPEQGLGPALPAYDTMFRQLQNKIHFALLNGDWLYEARRDYRPEQWLAQVNIKPEQAPLIIQAAPSIVGVWENYKLYYDQSDNLRRWHRHIPSFFTYDDHETLNDMWGAGTIGLRDRRAVFRDIGVQAWYDYLAWSNPIPFKQGIIFGQTKLTAKSNRLHDPQADFSKLDLLQATNLHIHWGTKTAGVNDNALDDVGGRINAGIYRIKRMIDKHTLEIEPPAKATEANSYSIGRRNYFKLRISNCDFFVLDTRGQRDMHDTAQPDKPGISMLGPAQRDWLIKGMQTSDADFFFVVSSVNFTIPHGAGYGTRASNKEEAWVVFLEEREKLINCWDRLQQPVFVLTGDLHNSFVIRISDNIWELGSGPHNSVNHPHSSEGMRPANGPFRSGPRTVDIRWSTHFQNDIPLDALLHPTYCVVQINNIYNNPQELGQDRWVAFPRPQVIFQYYNGRTGALRYAESILAP